MYISSEQISQLIQQQDSYFREMHGNPYGDQNDPRIQGVIKTQERVARMAGATPDYIAGGAVLAAEFGYGLTALSPWSGTIGAAKAGFGAAGLAGGIGAGALAAGGYMAAGAVANQAFYQPFRQGAQMQGMATSQVQGMMPGASYGAASTIASGALGMASSMRAAPGDLMSVMQQGLQPGGGLDASSLGTFQASFSQLVAKVQSVATVMKSSLAQAQMAMGSFQGMGFGLDQSAGLSIASRMYGQGGGLSPLETFTAANRGVQAAKAYGSDPFAGAIGGMQQAAMLTQAHASEAVPGLTPGDYGRFQAGAQRFMGSRLGGQFLAAIMNPETGEMDASVARRISQGQMSGAQIRSLAARNRSGGNYDMFMSSRGELAGDFLSQFGPAATSGAISSLTEDIYMGSTRAQGATGLNRRDLDMMSQFSASQQMLEQRVRNAAKQGFREGTGNMGLGDMISKAAQSVILDPIRRKMRDLAASVSRNVTNAVTELESDLYGGGSFSGGQGGFDFQQGAMAGATGGYDPISAGPSMFSRGIASPAAQGAARFVPPAFRMEGFSKGTTPLDFPMLGLALDEHNMGLSIGAVGLGATAALGRSPLSALGGALSRGGQFSAGVLGSGGGSLRGTARLVTSGLPLLGGGLLRGLGAGSKSKLLAGGVMGMDLLMNSGPALLRAFGVMGDNPRVTGTNAQLTRLYDGLAKEEGMGGLLERSDSGVSVAGTDGLSISENSIKRMAAMEASMFSGSREETENLFGGAAAARAYVERASRASASVRGMSEIIADRANVSRYQATKLLAQYGVLPRTDKITNETQLRERVKQAQTAFQNGDIDLSGINKSYDLTTGRELSGGDVTNIFKDMMPMSFAGKANASYTQGMAQGLLRHMGGDPQRLQNFSAIMSSLKNGKLAGGSYQQKMNAINQALGGYLTGPGEETMRREVASMLMSGALDPVLGDVYAVGEGQRHLDLSKRGQALQGAIRTESGQFTDDLASAALMAGIDPSKLSDADLSTGDGASVPYRLGSYLSGANDLLSGKSIDELTDFSEYVSAGGTTLGNQLAAVAGNVARARSASKRSRKDPIRFLSAVTGKDMRTLKRRIGADELAYLKGEDGPTDRSEKVLRGLARDVLASGGMEANDRNVTQVSQELRKAATAASRGDHTGAADALDLVTTAAGIGGAAGAAASPAAYRKTLEEFVYYLGQANQQMAGMFGVQNQSVAPQQGVRTVDPYGMNQ